MHIVFVDILTKSESKNRCERKYVGYSRTYARVRGDVSIV